LSDAIFALLAKTTAVKDEAARRSAQGNSIPDHRRVRCARAMRRRAMRFGFNVDVDKFDRPCLSDRCCGGEADPACAAGSDADRQAPDTSFAQYGRWYTAHGGRGRLAPSDPGQRHPGEPGPDAGFDPASIRTRPQSCILTRLHNYEPMSRSPHWKVLAFRDISVSALRSQCVTRKIAGH